MRKRVRYTTVIVRISRDESGRMTGIVERVKTRRKAPFHGLEEIGRVVAELIAAETDRECGDLPRA